MEKKHKYQVRLYYQTYCDMEIMAIDEQDAKETAYSTLIFPTISYEELGFSHNVSQLIDNLTPYMDHDVKIINE